MKSVQFHHHKIMEQKSGNLEKITALIYHYKFVWLNRIHKAFLHLIKDYNTDGHNDHHEAKTI